MVRLWLIVATDPTVRPPPRYHLVLLTYTGKPRVTNTDEIDLCTNLYLEKIDEPNDNELFLKIVEARSGGAPRPDDKEPDMVLREILRSASPILHGAGCKIFELYWPSYIAYSIRNESFCTRDAYEKFDGKLFVTYTRSRYLDFVTRATFADASHPGPFAHYGIFCLNHIIDVVSIDPPTVTVRLNA
jgi:hypothetical protein